MKGRMMVRYVYTECGSKNRSGGQKQVHMDNKVVHQYENLSVGSRCHAEILDFFT